MKNALTISTRLYRQDGIKVVVSYAASSALAKQIEQGAPADVFVSADTDGWITRSAEKTSMNPRVNLLGNSIV